MPRGGKRPGAGRHPKKNKRVKIAPLVDPASRDWIKAETKRRGVSQGRIIDELIRKHEDQIKSESLSTAAQIEAKTESQRKQKTSKGQGEEQNGEKNKT